MRPTDPDVIYAGRKAGTYHPLDCGTNRGGWCDCGGFDTEEKERAWCAREAVINLIVNDDPTLAEHIRKPTSRVVKRRCDREMFHGRHRWQYVDDNDDPIGPSYLCCPDEDR